MILYKTMSKTRNKVKHRRSKKKLKPWARRLSLIVLLLVFVGAAFILRSILPYKLYPIDYFDIITAEARAEGLDPYLVTAVIKAESNFQPDAKSPVGAVGLMQIMPKTGEWLAARGGFDFDEEMLKEPEYNIRLGCQYLRFLLDYWQWDVYKAVASYNAGQTNVSRWLDEGTWDGSSDNLADIPFNETQNYVNKVFSIYQEYLELYK